ncbi:hypothetical protein DPMN_087943 [Dreissena polymorpha]|uniref:Uncharacterized protein n=1 Tax=Dreissena polymorpha TaxID=45954 RepID=A0A9D4KTM2_DREPO|nr:hypothetical protein DPMN_087943 [Dreissena polymorpha]
MNLLTEFHEDQTINVVSKEKCPAHWRLCFLPTSIIFEELVQDIIGINLLTKFHEDSTINVASRVLTRFYYRKKPRPFQPTDIIFELIQDIIGMNLLTKKNAPPLGSHVFQANVTIFELIQDIIETNLLTKFHEDWTINANVDIARRTPDNGRRTKGDQKSST